MTFVISAVASSKRHQLSCIIVGTDIGTNMRSGRGTFWTGLTFNFCMLWLSGPLLAQPCVMRLQQDAGQAATDGLVAAEFTNQHQQVALLTLLLKQINCQLEIVKVPAARALKLLQSGELDVMVGMSVSPARQQFLAFIGPHQLEQVVAVGNKQLQNSVQNLAQLRAEKLQLSLTQGGFYGADLEQLLAKDPEFRQRTILVQSNQQKMALLRELRVDVTFADAAQITAMLQDGRLPATQFAPLFVLYENYVYFAFSKASVSASQLTRLQHAWQRLVKTGQVAAPAQPVGAALDKRLNPHI